MVFAVLDIGSNSCRLKIAEFIKGKLKVLFEDRETTRLMQGVAETGHLAQASKEASLAALSRFKKAMDEKGVTAYKAVATSAMREASDGEAFAEEIKSGCGIVVQIIPGEEEAALSYEGMRRAHPELKNPLMIDVGGGSSEFYLPGVVQCSLKMGAVKATEIALTHEIAAETLKELIPLKEGFKKAELAGCGGTITTLAAMHHKMTVYRAEIIEGTVIKREELQTLYKEVSLMTPEEKREIPGLQPKRADIIEKGLLWVLSIMENLDFSEITVSDADLREAILYRLYEENC